MFISTLKKYCFHLITSIIIIAVLLIYFRENYAFFQYELFDIKINTNIVTKKIYGVKVGFIDSALYDSTELPKAINNNILNPGIEDPHTETHGFSVASVLAANNSSKYTMKGLIPGLNLLSYNIPENQLDTTTLSKAIDVMSGHDVNIINISLGTYKDDAVLAKSVKDAIEKGVIIVASSGNKLTENYNYPASYPDVISVGSLDNNKNILFPSTVNDKVDIYAPGYNIPVLTVQNQRIAQKYLSGTSVSTPIVTSLIVLLKAKCDKITPKQAENILKETSNSYVGKWGVQSKKINSINPMGIIEADCRRGIDEKH